MLSMASCAENALPYLIIHAGWDQEPRGQLQLPVQHLHTDVFAQVGAAQPPVPVVCDVPSVHDLTKEVAEVIPRHLPRGTAISWLQASQGCSAAW